MPIRVRIRVVYCDTSPPSISMASGDAPPCTATLCATSRLTACGVRAGVGITVRKCSRGYSYACLSGLGLALPLGASPDPSPRPWSQVMLHPTRSTLSATYPFSKPHNGSRGVEWRLKRSRMTCRGCSGTRQRVPRPPTTAPRPALWGKLTVGLTKGRLVIRLRPRCGFCRRH